jgi:hypothetical protein
VLRLERLTVVGERDPRLAARDVVERQVGRVGAGADWMTYSAAVSTPSSSVSTETPCQTVPSLDHLVTQWMSTVTSSLGNARNSSQAQRRGSSTSPTIEKSHCSSGLCGVGPAERTGKFLVTYWPGGTRSLGASSRRPRKPAR